MSYLIVVLVIGAVLGPLMAVLPSKRQRYLVEQRDAAASLGLAVRLRALPEIPPRFRFEAAPDLVCYELNRDPREGADWRPGLFVRTDAGWVSRDIDRPVPDRLAALPDGAQVVSIGWDSVGVFWTEAGGEAALATIAEILGELRRGAE